jgi:hypothetical protein
MATASTTQPVHTPAPQFPTRTVHIDGDVISYTLGFTSDQMWFLYDTMINTEILLMMSIEDEDQDTWIHEKGTQRIAESKRLRLALLGIFED